MSTNTLPQGRGAAASETGAADSADELRELFRRARAGDRSALARLVAYFEEPLRQIANDHRRYANLVEDVRSDGYQALLQYIADARALPEADPREATIDLLRKKARAYVRRERKIAKREVTWSSLPSPLFGSDPGSGTDAEVAERTARAEVCPSLTEPSDLEREVVERVVLEHALTGLKERERVILALHVQFGMTFAEIALKVHSGTDACRKAYERGRRSLQTVLGENPHRDPAAPHAPGERAEGNPRGREHASAPQGPRTKDQGPRTKDQGPRATSLL